MSKHAEERCRWAKLFTSRHLHYAQRLLQMMVLFIGKIKKLKMMPYIEIKGYFNHKPKNMRPRCNLWDSIANIRMQIENTRIMKKR